MVISFSVLEARNQLLNEDFVYTFRWNRRAFFEKGKGEVESTWANAKRGGKRIAYVEIEEIGEMACDGALLPYASKSGFKRVWDWQCKILDMGNPHGNIDGWLYKVTRLQGSSRSPKE